MKNMLNINNPAYQHPTYEEYDFEKKEDSQCECCGALGAVNDDYECIDCYNKNPLVEFDGETVRLNKITI